MNEDSGVCLGDLDVCFLNDFCHFSVKVFNSVHLHSVGHGFTLGDDIDLEIMLAGDFHGLAGDGGNAVHSDVLLGKVSDKAAAHNMNRTRADARFFQQAIPGS